MSPLAATSRLARFRPTADTKFQIDFDWWEKSGKNFRLYLRDQLCDECRERFSDHANTEDVDWVDPETGEVHLRTRCANDPDFINERLPVASACFRIFLANNNAPLSPNELSQMIPWRSAREILGTLGGRRVYLGLRPVR